MRLLSEKEVAECLGMSVHWLRRQRVVGSGIPFLKITDGSKGSVRYDQRAVDEFIKSRVRRSTSEE